MGTPEAAVPTLLALSETCEHIDVLTQPDRPRGRSGSPVPPPVKVAAKELGHRVVQPHGRAELLEAVQAIAPFDVGVVVAFGMILDETVLAVPGGGFLNVHFSLLPRWRGAAPVERSILAGDENSGVTIMKMDAGLDTGPIVATAATPVGAEETAGELTSRIAVAGAALLTQTLPAFLDRGVVPVPQNEGYATYAHKITTQEAHLDFTLPAVELGQAVRAFNPRPGAWAIHGDRLKVWRATPHPDESLTPGELFWDDGGVRVGTGDGALELTEVQAAGRKSMMARDWVRGLQDDTDRLLR